MGSVWYPITIILLYLYVVKVVGPRFMKERPAYNLDKIIALYNIVQIWACFDLFIRAYTLGWGLSLRLFCEPVDYSNSPQALLISRGIWKYYLLKVVDILDTVFFILRKKNNQVTFLHVYHHAGMIMIAWIIARYVPGGHVTLVGATNCFVHVVMYGYYFITNMWPEYKQNIWWKKHITQLQLVQFVIIFCHSLPVLLQKDCNYPKAVALLTMLESVTMLVLFGNFYRKSYLKKKTV
ncbi:very long chain fatty acid elongase 7-like isoform X2 [Periplaneta americana]